MIEIAFITTVNHNVGDDFIREGIKYLLSKLDLEINYSYIHKHAPVSVRHGFESIRNYKFSVIIDNILPVSFSKDKILKADFLIQSGAPVFWCHSVQSNAHCADNEWYKPLIKKRFLKSSAKFINLAAGACQTWQSTGDEVARCPKCSKYIREINSLADVTTLRDNIARNMLNSLGIDAPVIPCTSIFVSDALGIKPKKPEYVAFNFMTGGGHYSFGQKIDYKKWNNVFADFYNEISKTEKCIFVCHSINEVETVNEIFPGAETFFSDRYTDYIRLYAKVKFGIMNRIHGALPIISFGRPAVIIGNDSRAKMAEVVGAKSYFVNDMTFEKLIEIYNFLNSDADNFSEKFAEIKENAEIEYLRILRKSFNL